MTEEMKAVLESKEKHMAIVARAGCVDRDTEFFTGKGWKKISEYEDGDMVLQFNSDWTAELVKPQQYIKEPCDEMNGIISKYGVNMILSDEHRVIYIDTSHNKEWGKQNILEIKCNEMIERHRKNSKGFYGKFITTFKFKGRDYKYFSSDDEIRLYMAVLSDGHIVNDNTKYIVMNLKKERKKERLVSLLNSLGIKYVEYKRKDGYTEYRFHFDKCSKRFDFELLDMCEHDRQVLFDEIPYWDGYYEKFIKSGRVVFFTTVKHNADFIQLLGASLNMRGVIEQDNRVGREKVLNKGKSYIMKTICYSVGFTNRTYVSIGSHSKPENRLLNLYNYKTPDGYKYCFVVPSGMLVLRRGDRIFITGNSGKSHTMLEYIKKNPQERILYLVYNKEMKEEFSRKIKEVRHNATISTIHSLAYKWYTKKYGKRQYKNINVIDIKNILKKTKLEFGELSLIKFYYEMYLCSSLDEIREIELLSNDHRYLLTYVQKVWDYYLYSDTIQHNFYLKMFQLSKEKIPYYETIIVDEVNDINGCMLSIIVNNLDKKVICVGDPLQNLNAFNYTIDGLSILIDKYKFKEYNLTMSFRVSDDVANLSSRYLSYMYDKPIKFHGCKHTKMGQIDLREASKDNQINLLCRNRLGGLMEIFELFTKTKNKKIYYVGGLDSFGIREIELLQEYNGNIYLGGEKYHINALRKIKEQAEENEEIVDPEISRVVSLYDFGKKYKDLIPLLKYTEVTDRKDADIIVQTAHSSKGGTYKNVYIAKDFKAIEDIKKQMLDMKESNNEYMYNVSKSEVNLVYVALTRATDIIDMNQLLNKKDKQQNRFIVEEDNIVKRG